MKLHIGCGQKFLAGYTHVDVMPFEHIDYIANAEDLHIFPNNSVSEIYACHILEHVQRARILPVLKEWYRVIQPKGLLRIAVPNFEAVVQEYAESKRLDLLQGLLYGGQNYDYNFHYVTFDFNSLRNYLEQAGFSSVKLYDWKDFLPKEFDDYSRSYLPHMNFNGRLMSLNITAEKL